MVDRAAVFDVALAYPRRLNNRMMSVLVDWSGIMADAIVIQSSEAQIRSVIEAWAQAIRAKDAAGVAARWAPDLVQFDLAPPLRTVGNDPQGLKDWFASWRGQIGFVITELRVTAGEDVAFCHALVHLTGSRTDGSESDVWFRDTLGLRKAGGVWKIAHGHESVPMRMDGSFSAAIDLKP
jgi:ketosteroid isomerase-like protein